MDEPLTNGEARKHLTRCLEEGEISWSRHARDEMANDNLVQNDVLNILERGWMYSDRPAEFEHGSWRYRFNTHTMSAVVAFHEDEDDGTSIAAVVTTWRIKR